MEHVEKPVAPRRVAARDRNKISAKCQACRARLFVGERGAYCKRGHEVVDLVSRTPKGAVSTKPKVTIKRTKE